MNGIRVQLHFTGLIDIKNLVSGDYLTLKEGSNLSDLLTQIGIRQEHKKYIISMVNEKKEFLHYMPKNDDQIKLFLPVGGG
ncbi:MAG: MoaD/ThiS family protein [Lentisphaerota bacterium]